MVAREERRRARIDQPRDTTRPTLLPRVDQEAFGRMSERVARFLGTWRFIGYMSLAIVAWVMVNTITPWHPDPYPFIFLTLMLSLQASYAAPLILLAQNRQSDRDRVQYDSDRALSERTVADTEYLTREVAALRVALGEVATRDFIRGELQRLMEEIGERRTGEPGDDQPEDGPNR